MTFCAPKSLGNLPAPAGLYRVHSVCLTVSSQLYTYHYHWRSSHGPGISTILGSSLWFHQWSLLSFLWGLRMAPGLNYRLGPFGLTSFTPLKPVSYRDYYRVPSLTASLGCSLGPAKPTTHWPWGNISCCHHKEHKILFQWSWFFSSSFSSHYRLFLTIF